MLSARYCCHILLTLEFSVQIFEKYSDIKFYEDPSSGSRVVPCGRTDMTKLIVAFCNYTNAPKIYYIKTYALLEAKERTVDTAKRLNRTPPSERTDNADTNNKIPSVLIACVWC